MRGVRLEADEADEAEPLFCFCFLCSIYISTYIDMFSALFFVYVYIFCCIYIYMAFVEES